MSENGFYRDKFFYVILLLLIGSFGWTTFVGWGLTQAMGHTQQTAVNLAKDNEAKAEALSRCNADVASQMKTEYVQRDELILASVTKEFQDIHSTLSEIKTDIKYLRKQSK